ncbi:hypothetical protein FTO68_06260 [Methanocalculus taiwanensis]|uniref:Uncharacterized protein n=1 Tax=Methanocalculus taiwanensis TaxID=106207 RepID=A0ABD4TI17_9EURY|nr:hypothetical protein [Methanocalculus taiwanensis]MCQ1538588.1 hypothetical protein [Methanocalculus taiwanensis]
MKIPQISLPAVKLGIGAGAGALAGAAVGGLGSALPKISLPDVGGAVSGTVSGIGSAVSGGISSVSAAAGGLGAGASGIAAGAYDWTYSSYDEAEKKMGSEDPGERLEGFGQYAGTLGFHVLAPVELGNVVSAHAEGRAGDLTLEDYAWAGFDAVFLASIPFTGGLGWVARSGIRTAIKGGGVMGKGKVVKGVPKAWTALKGLFSGASKAGKIGDVGKIGKAGKAGKAGKGASEFAAYQKKMASQIKAYQKSMASQIKAYQKGVATQIKGVQKSVKGISGAAPASRSLLRPLAAAGAIGVGGAGITALMLGAGGGDQVTGWDDGLGDPALTPGYYDQSGSPLWDSSMFDLPYDLSEDWYSDYGSAGYYPAAYPGGDALMPLEAYSQDMLDYMPFGEEINQKGIAFPVLLLGGLAVGAGGLYLYKNRAKIGRKIRGIKK